MADKTDMNLVAAILTAGHIAQGVAKGRADAVGGTLPEWAASIYFEQIEALWVEAKKQPKVGTKFR